MKENPANIRHNILYEVLNAVTHGIGTLAAIICALFMVYQAFTHHLSAMSFTAIIIYIIGVISFLLASTLFHSLVFTRAAKIFQFFDHSFIYFLILGTYTPYTWIVLHNTTGYVMWGVLTFLTVAGLVYDLFFVGRWPWLSVTIYLIMGWIVIFALPEFWRALSPTAFWLLFAGGVTYSAGTIFYMNKRIFLGHVWWHLFVLIGTGLMYASIYLSIF